ncbi:hypothetical protein HKD37_09G024815 [Glycine soja]
MHRQRVVIVVAKDVEHVDHAADEVHEEPHEPVMDHEHTELKLTSYERKVEKFERLAHEIKGIMVATVLSYLISCSLETGVFHTFDAIDIEEVVDLLVELLEYWIYKHFPTIVSIIVNEDYHERKSCACQWKCVKALTVMTYHPPVLPVHSATMPQPPALVAADANIPRHVVV